MDGIRSCVGVALVAIMFSFGIAAGKEPLAKPVSYHHDVQPIFQAHCQGCHQPAKPSGEYVMTRHQLLLAGGESGTAAIVPGKPDQSPLMDMITPVDGQAEMPEGKRPLSAEQITLIRRWIVAGAIDDTPVNVRQRYDQNHPPVYSLPPVITSVDYSADGKWLAVAGFHEVLLHRAEGGLVARLIGLAERIESVSFSPDGTRLAVTGGLPGRTGELQAWNLNVDTKAGTETVTPELSLSIPITFDTIYGGKWSPDSKLIAVGCADNSVRAFDVQSEKQVLFQGAHSDWVLDAVFSVDGKHLISVGRDMSAKLIEVATERFVDNITSITPGVLKGGIQSVARHPTRDEIVIGGADGVPKVYRVFRQTARRIGDDANLIRRLDRLNGRIFSVAISEDGKRIAAGSSFNGAGQVTIDSYEFDTTLTDELKKIMSKVVTTRSVAERKKLDAYRQLGVKRLASIEMPTGVFAVSFHPDGKTLAVGGFDGQIRLIDVASGKIRRTFAVAPESPPTEIARSSTIKRVAPDLEDALAESIPTGVTVRSLSADPSSVQLRHAFDYVQLLVTAVLDQGETLDITRMVSISGNQKIVQVTHRGRVLARHDGHTDLVISLAGRSLKIPVDVRGTSAESPPDFSGDVAPVIARLGCNQGTCHGAAKGKNGFKLSLRGYDPVLDVRAFTDDHASRRANVASPDDSLMLLKATSAVPHMGGQLMRPGDDAYLIIRNWIEDGAQLNAETPRVAGIKVLPRNPVIQRIGQRQQFRVLATYADGRTRDVTREAFISSGDSEIAKHEAGGLLISLRRGEAPVLARFQGAYDATMLTVMGDRTGFVWNEPATSNKIDQLVAAKWKRLKIGPAPICDDATFLRRVYLDLTGLPPVPKQIRAFVADSRPADLKRREVIDRLIGNLDFVDYWTNKWADLLMVNRKYLGQEGAKSFRDWIRNEIESNTPYDKFARRIITAGGSNRENPPASYYKILRTPEDVSETTTQLFMAIRFNCNKCHDHPFERWTQDQYYQTAAFFAQFELKPDPASKGRKIGGSAVEGAKPFYEILRDRTEGDVKHARTDAVAAPQFPFSCQFDEPTKGTRRERFAAWLTSADNPYFARSYVNRLWGYLLGVGLIEPLDDIRAGNPPTNPELLDYLTREFVESGMDMRHVMRLICRSKTYQRSLKTNHWNEDDHTNYSHALARRLPAEVIFDAMHVATGSTPKFPGVPAGTRASQLPDVGVKLPSGFLDTLGRPSRQSACECERINDVQLGVVMALINGPVVSHAIQDPNNALARLVKEQSDNRKLVEEIFLRILNRMPDDEEVSLALATLDEIAEDHASLVAELQKRRSWWAKQKDQLDKKRLAELAKTEADLAVYRKQVAPKLAMAAAQHKKQIEADEANLKQYEASLVKRAAEWARQHADAVEWHPLEPATLTATGGTQLIRMPDCTIAANGKPEKGVYTITFQAHLPRITGIRLEALPVPTQPGGGPGLSANGNFVVTEFEVLARPLAASQPPKPVGIGRALADFEQDTFSAAQSIDGNLRDQRGWAIHPAGGVVHWATFQFKQPLVSSNGTLLQIKIHQFHNAKDHQLARFRISATSKPAPLGLSLPESLKSVVATDEKLRTKGQQELLTDYLRKTDRRLMEKQATLAEARKPLPPEPGISQRESLVTELKKPITDDRLLVQLRQDTEASQKQLAEKRLTVAQDLAWALINSPAFLFNH